ALAHQVGQLGERGLPGVLVVRHDEAAYQQPVDQDRADVAQGNRLAGIAGDKAADGHPAERVHAGEDGIEDLSADVLEVAVDAVGGGRIQLLGQAAGLVVHADDAALFLRLAAARLRAAGAADDPAALGLGELAHL